jgi:general stress protein YciG
MRGAKGDEMATRRTTTAVRAPTKRRVTTTRSTKASKPAARKAPPLGGMTVREAGRKGGLIGGRKGGEAVKAARGIAFYKQIGRKGGQKVRELIAAGRAAMKQSRGRRRPR